jgi:hypothetical protein
VSSLTDRSIGYRSNSGANLCSADERARSSRGVHLLATRAILRALCVTPPNEQSWLLDKGPIVQSCLSWRTDNVKLWLSITVSQGSSDNVADDRRTFARRKTLQRSAGFLR